MALNYASARKSLEKTHKDLKKQAKALASDPEFAKMMTEDAEVYAHIIAKIDRGTYNVCDQCGGTISDERLKALPAAVLCYDCAGEKAPKAAKPAKAKKPAKPPKPAKAAATTKSATVAKAVKPATSKTAATVARARPAPDVIKVWVDTDVCSGSGRCAKAVPELFAIGKGGACFLKSGKKLVGGPDTLVDVPPALEKKVMAAANKCPDQCVFVEVS